MGRSPTAVRAISADERAILECALQYAPAKGGHMPSLDQLDSLQVVGKCECGCASVDFQHLKPGEIAEVVADAIGETRSGETVDVIVFALGGNFVALEFVGYSDIPATLPVPSTVRGWDGQGSQGAA
jgi:hypothetical protein